VDRTEDSVSTRHDVDPADLGATGGEYGPSGAAHGVEHPSLAEVEAMTPEEALISAAEVDGVRIVHRRERFPVPGTKAEKRAERAVSTVFLLAFLCFVGFVVAFIALPWRFNLPGEGSQAFAYYTPVLGATLGLGLGLMGIGAVLWAKWLMPEEEAVQDRHQDPEPDESQLLTAGFLQQSYVDSGLNRRSMLVRTIGLAGLGLGVAPLVAVVGSLLKKPGDQLDGTLYGEGTPIVDSNGRRISPQDIQPGGQITVFPGVPDGIRDAASPTLLIRLRPDQKVDARSGQADFGWEDFVAFSKICTHAGCPASLYEQQTSRLLCPCHQSQFEVLLDAKPVFGPATRSLPKLPIDVEIVDGVQYFVSRRDYVEPVGPGFWDRRSESQR
jgi:ubiquinol-cytochrome c reductase iron-sulfur subunit